MLGGLRTVAKGIYTDTAGPKESIKWHYSLEGLRPVANGICTDTAGLKAGSK